MRWSYGVETRIINQAVKNNPEKFPAGYVAELTAQEVEILRSKILTLEAKPGKGHYSKHGYKVFTERGLYMLATILKGKAGTARFVSFFTVELAVLTLFETLQFCKVLVRYL